MNIKHTCHRCNVDKPEADGEWHWIGDFMRWLCHACFHVKSMEAKSGLDC